MPAEVHLHREEQEDKKPDYVGKMQIYPAKFDIDISVCMSCQICVEVCPFEAIKMNNEFELSTDDRFGGLLLDRHQLSKSNEYFHQIHPTEAAEVDARLAVEKAKVEAKNKAAAEAAAAKAAAAAAAPPTPAAAGGAASTPAAKAEGAGAKPAAQVAPKTEGSTPTEKPAGGRRVSDARKSRSDFHPA